MEQLVFTDAPDGLELTGVFIGDPTGGLAVLSHGSAARFCQHSYVEIGRGLATRGLALLSGDTRGRDVVALEMVAGTPVAVGAGFERYRDSTADTAAWLRYGRSATAGRLVAIGHSMGGAKTVRAIAAGAPADALVLLSPAVSWPENGERVAVAREMVAAGRGDHLMPHRPDAPAFNVITAATMADRADLIEPVFTRPGGGWDAIDVPTLVLFSGGDDGIDADMAAIAAGWTSDHDLTCEIVPGADHDYRGDEPAIADRIATWLAGLPA